MQMIVSTKTAPHTNELRGFQGIPAVRVFSNPEEAEAHAQQTKRDRKQTRTRILKRTIPVLGTRATVWVVAEFQPFPVGSGIC